MKSKQMTWKKPKCNTLKKEHVEKTILVSACSKYSPCHITISFIDSIPGGGKPIFM